MDINFTGKRALVTGAGRGIGRELVKRLEKCGAKVIALSRTEEHLLTLKQECPTIELIVVDVGNWEETKRAVENVLPVDLLVNNAAIFQYKHFENVTEEDINTFFNINLKAAFNISQVVTNDMRSRGVGGAVVNVSSFLSKYSLGGTIVYSMTKAALDQMTRVMAVELGPHKIRVNSINPGGVQTEMIRILMDVEGVFDEVIKRTPMHRLSETSEVVDTILYLLSDKATMVHGARVLVDGGSSLG